MLSVEGFHGCVDSRFLDYGRLVALFDMRNRSRHFIRKFGFRMPGNVGGSVVSKCDLIDKAPVTGRCCFCRILFPEAEIRIFAK